jgi:hypothetical protein
MDVSEPFKIQLLMSIRLATSENINVLDIGKK